MKSINFNNLLIILIKINHIMMTIKWIIIILYYMEKFTDKEIGEILNLKENTKTTKRTRAKI